MRYLLLTIFSVLLLSSVIAQVKNGPDGDIVATGWYPVVKDTAIKGGYRSLPDTSARNSIKDEYRKAGMQVYTESDTTTWQLLGCLTNNCWVPLIMGRISSFAVDTVPLLAKVPRINGTIATVSGYHTPVDGGGGQFYWNDTSTAVANGGTVISVAGVSVGRWFRIFQGEVNVKWFGAYGNRTTDDAAAIQAAVDTKLPVYIPPGFYRLNSTIALNQRPFRGASTINTYFFSAPDINVFTLGIDATAGRFDTEITGFTVRTESADTSENSFVFTTPQGSQRSTGYKIHHVEINGTYGAAFWLYDTYRMDISHVGISRCNNALVVLGQVVQCSFYDVRANCDLSSTQATSTLLGNIKYGVYENAATFNSISYRPENVTFINCSFVGFQRGGYVGNCLYGGFNQCDFDLCQNIGLDVYNADGGFYLANSWINLNGTPLIDSSVGVRIYPSTTNRMPITIQNNNISISNSTSAIRFGIQVGGPSAAYYFKRSVYLLTNNITSQFTYGIYANRVRELTCNGNNIATAVVQEFFGDNIETSVINDNVCDTIQYSSNGSTVSVMNNRAVVSPSGTSTTLSASNGIIQATTAIIAGGGGTNDRKLYVNGSMGIRKDSVLIRLYPTTGDIVLTDTSNNRIARIRASYFTGYTDSSLGVETLQKVSDRGAITTNLVSLQGGITGTSVGRGKIDLTSNGVTVTNDTTANISTLTVNRINTSSSANIADFKAGGTTFAFVSGTGIVMATGGFQTSSASGYYGTSNSGLGRLTFPATGPTITHNMADAYPGLAIDQLNLSSAGNIAEFRKQGTTVAAITLNGGGSFSAPILYANANASNTATDTVFLVKKPGTGELTALNKQGAINMLGLVDQKFVPLSKVVTTSAYTITDADYLIWVNYTSGTHTITLPSAAGRKDREYRIKNITSNNVSISGIEASERNTLAGRGQIRITSDGTNWYETY